MKGALHPEQYDYCINTLGYGAVFDFIGVPYKPLEAGAPEVGKRPSVIGSLRVQPRAAPPPRTGTPCHHRQQEAAL